MLKSIRYSKHILVVFQQNVLTCVAFLELHSIEKEREIESESEKRTEIGKELKERKRRQASKGLN